jgi:hypothetical protein
LNPGRVSGEALLVIFAVYTASIVTTSTTGEKDILSESHVALRAAGQVGDTKFDQPRQALARSVEAKSSAPTHPPAAAVRKMLAASSARKFYRSQFLKSAHCPFVQCNGLGTSC